MKVGTLDEIHKTHLNRQTELSFIFIDGNCSIIFQFLTPVPKTDSQI